MTKCSKCGTSFDVSLSLATTDSQFRGTVDSASQIVKDNIALMFAP